MIVVLASASARAEIQSVAGGRRCIRARDRDELLRLGADVDAVVIEAENLLLVLGVVRHIDRDHPRLPVILITEQNSVDLRHLASVSVEAVLSQHQIAARLSAVLKSSAEIAFRLRRLGEECMRSELIPAPLGRLLSCALTSVLPPRRVQHLARLLHTDPSTIRRHWRRDVNSQGIQRVKDLLNWVILLHALSAKRPERSWRFVAKRIGTHERTLRPQRQADASVWIVRPIKRGSRASAASSPIRRRWRCGKQLAADPAGHGPPKRNEIMLRGIVPKCTFLSLVSPDRAMRGLNRPWKPAWFVPGCPR